MSNLTVVNACKTGTFETLCADKFEKNVQKMAFL